MAIFSNNTFTPVVEDESIENKYPHIMATAESAYEIAYEGYRDLTKLISSIYVSDILIENAVMTESANAEVLVEATIKEFVESAKKKFIEIRDKIIAWFKKMIDEIKVRFTFAKDFIKKYKARIVEKAKVANGAYKVVNHVVSDTVKADAITMMNTMVSTAHSMKKEEVDTFTSRLLAKVGGAEVKTVGDLKKKFAEDHYDAKATTQTALKVGNVEKMIKYCEGVENALAAMKDLQSANTKAIDSFIAKLEGSGQDVEAIQAKTNCYRTTAAMLLQLDGVSVDLIKQISREYISIMRGLLLWKPAKEAFEGDAELMGGEKVEESTSIFESALNLI